MEPTCFAIHLSTGIFAAKVIYIFLFLEVFLSSPKFHKFMNFSSSTIQGCLHLLHLLQSSKKRIIQMDIINIIIGHYAFTSSSSAFLILASVFFPSSSRWIDFYLVYNMLCCHKIHLKEHAIYQIVSFRSAMYCMYHIVNCKIVITLYGYRQFLSVSFLRAFLLWLGIIDSTVFMSFYSFFSW